jgi:GDP-D-mannose dehydratase
MHLKLRILVTGITGFVGLYLARKLLDLGHEVCDMFRRIADGNMPKRIV